MGSRGWARRTQPAPYGQGLLGRYGPHNCTLSAVPGGHIMARGQPYYQPHYSPHAAGFPAQYFGPPSGDSTPDPAPVQPPHAVPVAPAGMGPPGAHVLIPGMGWPAACVPGGAGGWQAGLAELVASAGPLPQKAVAGNVARHQRNLLAAIHQWTQTAVHAHVTEAMRRIQRVAKLVPHPPGSVSGMFRTSQASGHGFLLPAARLAVGDDTIRAHLQTYLGGVTVIPGFAASPTAVTGFQHVFSSFFNDRMLRPTVFVSSHVQVMRGLTQSLIDHAEQLRYSDVMEIPAKRRKYYFACSIILAAAQTMCLANYPGAQHGGLRNRLFNPNDPMCTDFCRLLAGRDAQDMPDPAELVRAAQPLANLLSMLIPRSRPGSVQRRRMTRSREARTNGIVRAQGTEKYASRLPRGRGAGGGGGGGL